MYLEDFALNNLQWLLCHKTQLNQIVYIWYICIKMIWYKITFNGWYTIIPTKSNHLYLIYEVHTIGLQSFFVWASEIVVESWKFSILLLYTFWGVWPIFMISSSNEQLQQQLEYTLLKPDCQSWWISKMQSGHEEERYAIKFCFELGKMLQKPMECFKLFFDHLAWIKH